MRFGMRTAALNTSAVAPTPRKAEMQTSRTRPNVLDRKMPAATRNEPLRFTSAVAGGGRRSGPVAHGRSVTPSRHPGPAGRATWPRGSGPPGRTRSPRRPRTRAGGRRARSAPWRTRGRRRCRRVADLQHGLHQRRADALALLVGAGAEHRQVVVVRVAGLVHRSMRPRPRSACGMRRLIPRSIGAAMLSTSRVRVFQWPGGSQYEAPAWSSVV